LRFADFEALSFDCYGTLIDWEAGIAAVLGPWRGGAASISTTSSCWRNMPPPRRKLSSNTPASCTERSSLAASASSEPTRRAGHRRGRAALAGSVPDWPAFEDSHDALSVLGERFKLIILSNVDRVSFTGSQVRLGSSSPVCSPPRRSAHTSPRRVISTHWARRSCGSGGKRKVAACRQSLFHDHLPAKRAGFVRCGSTAVTIARLGATPAPPPK